MIEGPKGVKISVQKDGSQYVQTNNTKFCSLTNYGIKILKGDNELLTMNEKSGQINVVV